MLSFLALKTQFGQHEWWGFKLGRGQWSVQNSLSVTLSSVTGKVTHEKFRLSLYKTAECDWSWLSVVSLHKVTYCPKRYWLASGFWRAQTPFLVLICCSKASERPSRICCTRNKLRWLAVHFQELQGVLEGWLYSFLVRIGNFDK